MSISVHVVDCANGRPAADMAVSLSRDGSGEWREQARGRTDADGRLADWPPGSVTRGIHRLEFDLDGYFASIGITPFYPRVAIVFRMIDPLVPIHIPLLITPHGYATYRG
jgi:hydroxyisourate hydrolase